MHLQLRIIHEDGPESYSDEEEQQLRECVASASDVQAVKEVKRHSRGGYSVTIDGERSGIEQIVSYLIAAGYRLVI